MRMQMMHVYWQPTIVVSLMLSLYSLIVYLFITPPGSSNWNINIPCSLLHVCPICVYQTYLNIYFCKWYVRSFQLHKDLLIIFLPPISVTGPSDIPLAPNAFEAFLKVPKYLRPHTQIYCTRCSPDWIYEFHYCSYHTKNSCSNLKGDSFKRTFLFFFVLHYIE